MAALQNSYLMADARQSIGTGEIDGILVKFNTLGDTLWTADYGITGTFDVINALDLVDSMGYALFGTVKLGQYHDVRLILTDTTGNVLLSQTYGGWEDQQCTSGHRTLDGGYVLAGFNYFNNDNSDLYVVKVDSLGNQQWAQSYGSPWIDNVGFIIQLPDSGYMLAGGRRLSETGLLFPTFYRLSPQGGVVWSSTPSGLISGVLFADPIYCPGMGFVAAGDRKLVGGQTVGRLTMVDLSGDLLWDRAYQTNGVADHYFYDVERTLDGGFIMAGTTFDSLLISQDAWLVKVDSFGCLVPGCQIFDGLHEQFTDLTNALTIYPNPVTAGSMLQVGIELPAGFATTGALSLGLVSGDGRLLREQVVPNNTTRAEVPTTGLAPGLYYLHLRDDARWLSGGKVVVE
jgi:hypothetical protein